MLRVVQITFVWVVLSCIGTIYTVESRNETKYEKETVQFSCSTKFERSVIWAVNNTLQRKLREKPKLYGGVEYIPIYTGDDVYPSFKQTGRYNVSKDKGVYTLTISELNVSETGPYFCHENWASGPLHMYYLSVLVNVSLFDKNETLLVYAGSNVTLPCNATGDDQVEWLYIKSENAQQHVIFSNSPVESNYRDKVPVDRLPGDYSLTLDNMQLNESGWYICINYGIKHHVYLDVHVNSTGDGAQQNSPNLWFLLYLFVGAGLVCLIFVVVMKRGNINRCIRNLLQSKRSVSPPEAGTGGNDEMEPLTVSWQKQIQDNTLSLVEIIEPDHGLLIELRSSGVINNWTSPPLEDQRTMKSQRVRDLLLHIHKRTDEDFELFCSALRNTNQNHVVDELLMVGGTDLTDSSAVSFGYLMDAIVQGDESELQRLLVPNWKHLIKVNRNDIIKELEVSDALLNDLVKYQVMNDLARGEITSVKGANMKRGELLLDYMQRRPNRDFACFRFALEKRGQAGVIDKYLNDRGASEVSQSMPSPASTSGISTSSLPRTSLHYDGSLGDGACGMIHPASESQNNSEGDLSAHDTSQAAFGNLPRSVIDKLSRDVLRMQQPTILQFADDGDVFLDRVLDHLISRQKPIISDAQKHDIKAQRIPKQRLRKLLDYLLEGGLVEFIELGNAIENFGIQSSCELASELRTSLERSCADWQRKEAAPLRGE